MTETWRSVWTDFSRTYSYFGHKGIDWDQVWREHAADFEQITDATQFAIQLNEILQVLKDWHVYVGKPDGQLIGYRGKVTVNYHPSKILLTHYAAPSAYENLKSAGAIFHARVQTNIAHIVVLTLGDRFTQNIADDDLQNLFQRYRDAAGWIVDLRANTGGNEINARRFASFLTETPRVYGYSRTRIPGEDRRAFTGLAAREMPSRGEPLFRGPVIGLVGQATISSAEAFALMLRALPNGILIGDTTRGSSGNPVLRRIDSLGVSYAISTWMALDARREPYEGAGIAPDIRIPPENSYTDERDFVLERAIEFIRRPSTNEFGVPDSWIQQHQLDLTRTSDADGDGFFDRFEWAAGTNPRDAASLLRVNGITPGPSGAGWTVKWPSVPGKRYRVHRAAQLPPDGSFQPVSEKLIADRLESEHTDLAAGQGPWFYRVEIMVE